MKEIYDYDILKPLRTVSFHEIYPDLTTELELPEKLYNNLSEYLIYDKESKGKKYTFKVTTNYLVAEVENGRLYTDNLYSVAVISACNKLLADVSYLNRPVNRRSIQSTKFMKRNYFVPCKTVSGIVCNLLSGGSATKNTYHWFIDSIAKIHLVKKAGLFEKINWFVVSDCSLDYQLDSFEFLGIPKSKLILSKGRDFHIKADKIISVTNTRGVKSLIAPKWSISFLHGLFHKNEIVKRKTFSKFVYITRFDSKKRNITNEINVIKHLERLKFKPYTLSELTFYEKIDLFANADIIISASGAGLTNLFLCKENSHIIELFGEGFVNKVFCNLAKEAGMNYHCLIFKSKQTAKNIFDAQFEDIFVDLDEVNKLLMEIIDD